MKEEDYDENGQIMQTRFYFFDYVSDPFGDLFKNLAGPTNEVVPLQEIK
ncbi:hypothetical protein G3578_08300 [Brevibacillus sp. SYP-B805]|nr:hypothetical protein [Brevibacillus sp. SYP-B805]NGQ95167.1 hypothetical protein [Brevibacillus sp. SYP-B805]